MWDGYVKPIIGSGAGFANSFVVDDRSPADWFDAYNQV